MSPVRAPKSAARAFTGMDMPAPVRTFRSLAEAVPASRQSAGTMMRNMGSLGLRLVVARGPWAFYQGSRDAQSEGEGDEKDCFRSRSNGFGDAISRVGNSGCFFFFLS